MNKLLIFLLSLIFLFVMSACEGKQDQKDEAETTVEETVTQDTTEMAGNVIDCDGECGMTMEKDKMIAHVHEGDTLHFCSENCKEHYLAAEHEGEMEE